MVDYRKFPKLTAKDVPNIEARAKLNRLSDGKMNTNGTLTLTANAATTTLTDPLIDSVTRVALMPTTANAAAALATTWFSAPTNGSVVINHANNAQTDRTLRYSVVG